MSKQAYDLPPARMLSAALLAVALGVVGCDQSQELTGTTANNGFGPSGGTGGGGSGAGSSTGGGAGPVAIGGSSGAPPTAIEASGGASGATAQPEASTVQARVEGCVDPMAADPAPDVVACGLSPHIDLVAVDATGLVLSRRLANGLVRVDRNTASLTTIDTTMLGMGNGGRLQYPMRDGGIFAVRGGLGPIESIDLVTGWRVTLAADAQGHTLALTPGGGAFFQRASTGVLAEAMGQYSDDLDSAFSSDIVAAPGVVAAGYVYAQRGDELIRVPVKGGASELVHTFVQPPPNGSVERPSVWTIADGALYWVENGGFYGTHRVLGRSLEGGEASVYATLPDYECDCAPTRLQVANGRLSFLYYSNVQVGSTAHPELSTSTVFPGYVGSGTYVIHDGFVYAAGSRGGFNGPSEGFVQRAPLPALP